MGMRCKTPSPFVPAGAHELHVHPFGGEKVHWTFSCFRLTSREGRGEVGRRLHFIGPPSVGLYPASVPAFLAQRSSVAILLI